MILHENKQDFKDLIVATSQALGIREVYVEKDYWVTYSLKNLSNSDFVDVAIFKGGTSLSKALNVIERFSEDIDLAIAGANELSGNQVKNLVKSIQQATAGNIREIEIPGITSKGSKFRKTAHKYETISEKSNYAQASDKLLIEVNAFANPTPFSLQKIQSYIGIFLSRKEQFEAVAEFQLEEFEVNVLDIKRTFVEKIFSLIRASYAGNPIEKLKNKVRHIYDLERILQAESVYDFLFSPDFFSTIEQVKSDDSDNHEFQGDWLSQSLMSSVLFDDINGTWEKLEATYNNEFAPLVYGELPDSEKIKTALKVIAIRLEEYDKR